MNADVYLLLTGADQNSPEVIYSRNSDLKIRVYCVGETEHTLHANEIQLYGYCNGSLLIFETVEIQADDALDMIPAIRWYANYMDNPDMEILPDDPRIGQEIAV
ncbi:hypothetical protein [Mucilaginibacter paludis]|uniref:Uncharacterized protein n=1 Tax=Mucilaginibacter paludis DSM 18603 TaxID=714943 RepID=H1Y4D4_9SPHI|nr:hypothetical protein [Mucilaginibacter paludis]EHQ25768.1 hypothetical protein Mucpa_1611 [Mucilaginibacter paludis DSM 18603]